MAVNAQSIQESVVSSLNASNISILDKQVSDNQDVDESELVLVQSFSTGASLISQTDGDKVEIKSYPNPATDHVMVEIPGLAVNDHVQIWLYSMNGQLVGNWTLVNSFATIGNAYRLNIENLTKGTYILQVKNNSINLNQTKLIEKF